jgi:hypothetical protein
MRDQSIGFLAHVVAHQQPAGAAGKSGHVCVPSLQHQVEAGAQAIPALLGRRDARVAVADLEGDRGDGKCFLEFVDPWANHSI